MSQIPSLKTNDSNKNPTTLQKSIRNSPELHNSENNYSVQVHLAVPSKSVQGQMLVMLLGYEQDDHPE